MKVVVIGAGIVGLACAAYLRRDNHEVTIIEQVGPGEGTSKGNAGALSPGSCVPLAMPGVFGKIPGWLMDSAGPLTIRPRYFLTALPWLLRFANSSRRVAPIADALRELHRHVYECYQPLIDDAGCGELIRRTGTLMVYRSAAALNASRGDWRLRTERGVEVRMVSAGEMRDIEPALAPAIEHGVFLPEHGYVANPYRLAQVIAARFVANGGRMLQGRAGAVRRLPGGGLAVPCDRNELEADRVIIAAGARSGDFTRPLGLNLPLETQRGYHVTLTDAGFQPRVPVTLSEGKFYVTPMEGGVRTAGTVEFAGLEAPPDYRRARRLLAQTQELFPQARIEKFTEWMGHRPCMPDSLPVIGPARGHPGVLLAFGHGHNGMTSGPVTGRLIADMVAGRKPFIDPAPYSPERF
jgi:D-amino-acid dehydrogenase